METMLCGLILVVTVGGPNLLIDSALIWRTCGGKQLSSAVAVQYGVCTESGCGFRTKSQDLHS